MTVGGEAGLLAGNLDAALAGHLHHALAAFALDSECGGIDLEGEREMGIIRLFRLSLPSEVSTTS